MSNLFDGTSVKVLTGADFDNVEPWNLQDKKCAFVLFFADWCGHCRDFKPEYSNFADAAQFIRVYAVDSDANETLMNKLQNPDSPVQVQGFPTVWMYSHGKPLKQYEGKRSWQELLKTATKLCKAECDC